MANEDLSLTIGEKGADEAAKKLDNLRGKLSDTGKETTGLGDRFNKAAVAFAAVGVGLTAYSKHATDATVDYVKNINSISRITGDTVETTSRLQYVFQRSGVAADQAAQVFGIFSKQITATNDAAKDGALKQQDLNNKIDAAKIKIAALSAEQTKNGDATGAIKNQIQGLNIAIAGYNKQLTDTQTPLEKLGVATKDADGKSRSFNDILLDVADKFKSMPNGAEKTATALDLFGRSGKNLIPILSKGKDGIQELENQADKLGITLTTKNIDAVAKYTAAQKTLKDAQQQFTLAVGTAALPMWQKLADAQVKATQILQGLPGPLRAAAADVVAFGGPVATAASGVLSLAANAAGAAPIMTKLSGAFKAVSASLGWVALIGLAVAALVALQIKTDFLGHAWTNLLTAMQPVTNWIQANVIPAIVAAGQFIWSFFKPAIDALWQAMQQLGSALAPILPYLETFAKIMGVVVLAAIGVVLVAIAAAVALVVGLTFAIIKVITWLAQFEAWVLRIANAFWNAVESLAAAGNRIPQIIGNAVTQANNILLGWIGTFYNSGKALLEAFGNGIESAFGKVKDTVSKGLSAVRRLLPFSDAKEGPLSTLTLSGRRFAETFAHGIDQGAGNIQDSATAALSGLGGGSAVAPTLSPSASIQPVPNAQDSSALNGGVTVQLSIGTMVGGDDASMRGLAVQMAQLVQDALKGQGVDNVSKLRATA